MRHRRVLSALLITAVAAGLLTGCSETEDPEMAVEQATEEISEEPEPEVYEIPQDYKYYFSLDGGEAGVHAAIRESDATPMVHAIDSEVIYIPGVKGNAAFTDGTQGLKLDINGVGQTYTVSYWVYATRFAKYTPSLQFGPDMHGDTTGGQHYVNITWASWVPGFDELSFPSVWAYYQNDEGSPWPYWYTDVADNHEREWVNITMTVDPADVSEDGTMIEAKLYMNGERLMGTDSSGNIRPVNVVKDCMEPSVNFDFLLGINYWDSVMKGAFDEVYVYDYVLNEGQVKALYEAGDTSVAFQVPDYELTIIPDQNALDSIGNVDFTNGWWSDWTESFELKDGETKALRFNNFSDVKNYQDNYAVVFTNEYTPAHKDPNTAGSANHVEYGAVRADAYGWGDTFTQNHDISWGENWDMWMEAMKDALVYMYITRDDGNITMDTTILAEDGQVLTNKTTLESKLKPDDPIFFLMSCEASYVELLSIDNIVDKVGKPDFTNGWWTDWAAPIEIKDGKTTVTFKNYSDGHNNWDNYSLIFTNENTPAHENPNAEASGSANHKEYGAVRADAYGWGGTFSRSIRTNWGSNWGGWLTAMKDAKVTLEIERNGGDITIEATILGADGETYSTIADLKSKLTSDDPVYMIVTCEACLIEINSIEQ